MSAWHADIVMTSTMVDRADHEKKNWSDEEVAQVFFDSLRSQGKDEILGSKCGCAIDSLYGLEEAARYTKEKRGLDQT